MSSNPKTIAKNLISKEVDGVKMFQPVMSKAFCYHTMKSAKESVNNKKHDWGIKKCDERNSYNTNN